MKQTARQRARARGAKTYSGTCAHHGRVQRYVSNGGCVICNGIVPAWSTKTEVQRQHIAEMARKRRAKWRAENPSQWKAARLKARRARDRARAVGSLTYIGHIPCKKCNGRRRLVSNAACAAGCSMRSWRDLTTSQKAHVLKRQRQDKRRQALALKVLQNLGVKIFAEGDPL